MNPHLIGHNFNDQDVQSYMKIVQLLLMNVECKGKRKDFTPEEILSMILVKIKETAESFLGTQVKNAVTT
ncbi:heat shock protein 70, partial [Rhizophagus irregularis]